MSQGIASRYVGKEITICQNCFHGNVCGNRDYLTENECCNFVSEAPIVDKVAVALQEKLERERPEPLSIDQLRQMGGDSDPVWVQDLLIPSCSTWHFVRERDEEILLFDEFALAGRIVGYNVTSGHNYGVTWLAYTHKPEQEGKT